MLGLFGAKPNVKATVGALLDRVYGLKRELLRLELKRELLLRYEQLLEETHERLKRYTERLEAIDKRLQEACRLCISEANDEMGRNVEEYYAQAVEVIAAELETRWGARFEFDERRMGSVAKLLEQGDEAYAERLMQVARSDWFTHSLFAQPFEQELLERANVTVSYENRQALTKEELYRDLCRALDEESAIRVDVYRFTHRHRYEESYLFGDADSELLRYALASGEQAQTKLGCMHEQRRSGVEKLRIMGGFRREDLMVYRGGRRFYETYLQNGYRFHRPDGKLRSRKRLPGRTPRKEGIAVETAQMEWFARRLRPGGRTGRLYRRRMAAEPPVGLAARNAADGIVLRAVRPSRDGRLSAGGNDIAQAERRKLAAALRCRRMEVAGARFLRPAVCRRRAVPVGIRA